MQVDYTGDVEGGVAEIGRCAMADAADAADAVVLPRYQFITPSSSLGFIQTLRQCPDQDGTTLLFCRCTLSHITSISTSLFYLQPHSPLLTRSATRYLSMGAPVRGRLPPGYLT